MMEYLARLPLLAYAIGLLCGFSVAQFVKAHRLKVLGRKPSHACLQRLCGLVAALFTAAIAFRWDGLNPIDCAIHAAIMLVAAPVMVKGIMSWAEYGPEGSIRRAIYDTTRIKPRATPDPEEATEESDAPVDDSRSIETGTWYR